MTVPSNAASAHISEKPDPAGVRENPIAQDRHPSVGATAAVAAGSAIIVLLGVLSAFGPLSMDMYLPT